MDEMTETRLPNAEQVKSRKAYKKKLGRLKQKRASHDPHLRELSDHIQPRRSQFLNSQTDRGEKRNTKIINNTPVLALATLAAGIQAGCTSKARPWYDWDAPTPQLNENAAVKEWIHKATEISREVAARSNAYEGFHTVYEDTGWSGTALMWVEEHEDDVLACTVFPVGQYYLAADARGRVCAVYRCFTMTASQLVEKFGAENCSQKVRDAYKDESRQEDSFDVVHVVEKNAKYSRGKLGARGKPWSSCWFEDIADGDVGLLRESGYEEQPFMGPRWAVLGEETYGRSPGMDALGDCKALQLLEERSAQAFDKVVNPPMKGPTSLNGGRISLLPGDITYTDSMSPSSSFSPAHEVKPEALNAFEVSIEKKERRVNLAFHVQLWLALVNSEQTMTAREVAERHEEKMMQLGPVVERFQNELYDPFLDRLFAICLRRGLFPPVPDELQGRELKVEYTSVMAQAQKLIGTTAVERLASFVGNLSAAKGEVLDVVDFDQMVQEYARMLGVNPALVRSDEAIARIRKAVAEANAQAKAQEQAMAGAQGAKLLSETDLQGDNALKRLLGGLGGAAGVAPR